MILHLKCSFLLVFLCFFEKFSKIEKKTVKTTENMHPVTGLVLGSGLRERRRQIPLSTGPDKDRHFVWEMSEE